VTLSSRTAASAAGAAAALLAAAAGGAALALGAHFARRVLTPALAPESGVAVVRLEEAGRRKPGPEGRLVWLSGDQADLRGRYSFIFDGGESHARLGEVERAEVVDGRLRVAREVLSVERGRLRVGARGRITGWWYTHPEELGLEAQRVRIPLENGVSWGWLVKPLGAEGTRWAVHVHGRGALPEETFRGLAPLARAGVTSVVLAYRNDPGAPRGVRGRYGLGLAERRDVDSAIAWARERGAARVTLVGYSMGGTAAVLSARGPHRGIVDGIVLDSPALDWPGVFRQQARLAGAPGWVADLGRALLGCGIVRGAVPGERGTDLGVLTPERLAAGVRVPVLIHASPEDTFVPWDGALEFARRLPGLAVLRESGGEHVKLWNTDPAGWERATEAFVRGLGAPAVL